MQRVLGSIAKVNAPLHPDTTCVCPETLAKEVLALSLSQIEDDIAFAFAACRYLLHEHRRHHVGKEAAASVAKVLATATALAAEHGALCRQHAADAGHHVFARYFFSPHVRPSR